MMNLEGGGGTQLVMPGASALVTSSDGSLTDTFPVGLRVMVVDDDLICLSILERMLHKCSYNATKCTRAERALSLLRANKNGYDVILSDIRMPDMDGFRFLELVGLEMDLPVIMMSADDGKNVVLQGVTHGACDYLIKPVRIEALKNIWQHVARKKRRNEWRDVEQSGSVEDGDRLQPQQQPKHDDADYSSAADDGSWRNSKRRKDDEEDGEDKDDTSTLKKPRVVWSAELHQQFVTAVKQLGIDKAVPKKILELMNVPGLTRENVASHLQKYRLYLRRITAVGPHQAMMNQSFLNPHGAAFGQMPPLAGFDLQALAISGQLLPHNHHTSSVLVRPASKPMDQRNIFSFEIPKQQQQYPSLMHGYHPTLISRQQQQQPSLLQSSSSPPPPIQQQQNDQTQMSEGFHHRQQRQMVGSISDSMNNMYNPPPVSQSEASPPVQTKPGSSLLFHGTEQQDPEEMEKKASSLLPSYDLVHQKTKYAWEMQHHHHHHHHQALSHFNASSAVQLGLFRHNNSLPSSGGEGVPASAFGQDDLLNALLKQETVLGGEEFGIEAFSLDNIPL